jgi:hypothetical protein
MTQSRDPETLISMWLEDGPIELPDETRRAIAVGLRTQSRVRRWAFPGGITMTPLTRVATAAAILVAVGAVSLLLVSNRNTTSVGGVAPPSASSLAPTSAPSVIASLAPSASPSSSAVAAATPSPTGGFGGIVHFQSDGAPATTEVDAVSTGGRVSGSAVSVLAHGTHTVRLECGARQGVFWVVAGAVEKTTVPGEAPGPWSAVIVKDGSPQRIAIWFSGDAPAGSGCSGFVASIDIATIDPSIFAPVESGALVAPPDFAP